MAEETILTPEEQSEIFREQSFKLAREMAVNWSQSLGAHAPVAMCSAIDTFAQMLVAHVGVESAIEFLDELSKALRKGDRDAEKSD